MTKIKTQTDSEFLQACGFDEYSNDASVILRVRHEFAELADRKSNTILSETKMIDLLNPADSLDILEWTITLEKALKVKLNSDIFTKMTLEEYECMDFSQYLHKIFGPSNGNGP